MVLNYLPASFWQGKVFRDEAVQRMRDKGRGDQRSESAPAPSNWHLGSRSPHLEDVRWLCFFLVNIVSVEVRRRRTGERLERVAGVSAAIFMRFVFPPRCPLYLPHCGFSVVGENGSGPELFLSPSCSLSPPSSYLPNPLSSLFSSRPSPSSTPSVWLRGRDFSCREMCGARSQRVAAAAVSIYQSCAP